MGHRVGAISSLLAATAVLAFAAASPAFTPAAEAQSVTWKRLFPKQSPSARAYSAMAYDPVSKKVVLFGGYDGNGAYLNETWTFDGNTWTKLKLAVFPPARAAASMAFDRVTRKLVLFGGFRHPTHYFGD